MNGYHAICGRNRLLRHIRQAFQLVLDIRQRCNLGLGLLQVQSAGIVGIELLDGGATHVALHEVLVVVEVAVIGRNAIEVAQILCLGAFFLCEQGLIHLLPVADANHLDVFLLPAEELAHGFGLGLDGAGGGFLHQDVTVLAVLEGKEDQVHGLLQAHDEAGHPGLGEGNGIAMPNLVYPQGYHAAAGAHHIAVAGAADLGGAAVSALGHGDLLFYGLGDTHGVDGIGGFVGAQANHALHAGIDGHIKGVIGANHVGLHGFHGEELAAGHLLEGGGMEHVIDALHGILEGALAAHVANVELDLAGHVGPLSLILVAHIVLLLLVTREDADFTNICSKETVQNRIPETSSASGNQEDLVFENGHIILLLLFLFQLFIYVPSTNLGLDRRRYRDGWDQTLRYSTSR